MSSVECLNMLRLEPVLGHKDCLAANSGRQAHNSKTLTTKTVEMITQNDQLLLTCRPQMLTTSNAGGWCAGISLPSQSVCAESR